MYCRNCGNQISEGSKFCLNCGESVGITSAQVPVNTPSEADDAKLHKGIITRFICLIIIAAICVSLPFLKVYVKQYSTASKEKNSFIELIKNRSDILESEGFKRQEEFAKFDEYADNEISITKTNAFEIAAVICYVLRQKIHHHEYP